MADFNSINIVAEFSKGKLLANANGISLFETKTCYYITVPSFFYQKRNMIKGVEVYRAKKDIDINAWIDAINKMSLVVKAGYSISIR